MFKMRFTLPFFIALVLMLSSFTFKLGQVYNYKGNIYKKLSSGVVLGEKSNKLSPLTAPTNPLFIPPMQSDFVPADQSTESETKQVIRNANGTFTEVEKVVTDSGVNMRVRELEATGSVIKETYYPLKTSN